MVSALVNSTSTKASASRPPNSVSASFFDTRPAAIGRPRGALDLGVEPAVVGVVVDDAAGGAHDEHAEREDQQRPDRREVVRREPQRPPRRPQQQQGADRAVHAHQHEIVVHAAAMARRQAFEQPVQHLAGPPGGVGGARRRGEERPRRFGLARERRNPRRRLGDVRGRLPHGRALGGRRRARRDDQVRGQVRAAARREWEACSALAPAPALRAARCRPRAARSTRPRRMRAPHRPGRWPACGCAARLCAWAPLPVARCPRRRRWRGPDAGRAASPARAAVSARRPRRRRRPWARRGVVRVLRGRCRRLRSRRRPSTRRGDGAASSGARCLPWREV